MMPFEQVQCWPDRLEIPLHWRAPRLCFAKRADRMLEYFQSFALKSLAPRMPQASSYGGPAEVWRWQECAGTHILSKK